MSVEDEARAEAATRYWQHPPTGVVAFLAGAAWQAAQPVPATAEQIDAVAQAICEEGGAPWSSAGVTLRFGCRAMAVAALSALGIPVDHKENDRG